MNLFDLAIRYFIQNKNRTIRGAKVIALSLLLIGSSNVLIDALDAESTKLTALLGNDNTNVIIKASNSQNFSKEELNHINFTLANFNNLIVYQFYFYKIIGQILTNNQSIEIPVYFTNLTALLSINNFENLTLNYNSIGISDDLSNKLNLQIGEFISLNLNSTFLFLKNEYSLASKNELISSGIYINNNLKPQNFINYINIKFKTEQSAINFLEKLNSKNAQMSRGDDKFVKNSFAEVKQILLFLQFFISIIIFLSVSNIIATVILESSQDIKILKELGYSRLQIRSIFLIMSFFMGLIGSILASLLSYLTVSGIIAFLVSLFSFPYISIELNSIGTFTILLNGILVSLIGSLLPIIRGI